MPLPTITYRTTGPWGAGKGSNLTAAEFDTDLWNIIQWVSTTVAGLPTPVGVSNVTASGNEVTIHLSDGSSLTPFTISGEKLNWMGAWTPTTPYSVNDCFYVGSTVYIVLIAHTSAATFDALAGPGYYNVMISVPSYVGPVVITDDSLSAPPGSPAAGSNYIISGTGSGAWSGHSTGEIASYNGTSWSFTTPSEGYLAWGPFDGASNSFMKIYTSSAWEAVINGLSGVVSISADRTFALADAGKRFRVTTSGSNKNLTVPPNSSVAFRIGTVIEARQEDEGGSITFVAGSGVTLTTPEWARLKTGRKGDLVRIVKVATNEWQLNGDLVHNPTSATVSAGSYDIDAADGQRVTLTIGATTTLNYSPQVMDSRTLTLKLKSDGTARTVTFGTNFASTGTLTTSGTLDKIHVVRFEGDGSGTFTEVSRVGPI